MSPLLETAEGKFLAPPEKLNGTTTHETKEKNEKNRCTFKNDETTQEQEPFINENEVAEVAEVIVPPDGGWGWVVVMGSFACNMIVDGIIFSFGMFLPKISESLNVKTAQIALVGSLLSGFYLIVGPFASALANKFGFRIVAITGSVLGALAFVLSYFATNVEFLCISYGIIGGIGFGFIYVPAVITVGFYFERWRALATGIGVCGSGIGTFLFAPLSSYLIEQFGWREALLYQSAIVLSCAAFGALFRPLKPTPLPISENKEPEEPKPKMDKLSLVTRLKMEELAKYFNAGNIVSENQTSIQKMFGVNNNSNYPTVYDVYHTISVPQQVTDTYLQEKRLSVPFITPQNKPTSLIPLKRANKCEDKLLEEQDRRNTMTDVTRPLYRDDIFFSASLNRLPQYTSRTSVAYNLSVTRIPTRNDIEEEKSSECKVCSEAVKRTLVTMLDFKLLKSPSFLLLAIGGAFTMMGFYIPFMYLSGRAVASGINEATAIWLVSAIGIANTVGRVLCGVLSSFPKVNALFVNNAALTLGGVATLFSGFSMSESYQFTYCVIFGLSISCFASLRPVIVVELLGLEKLTNAFGLLLLFQGVAACVGAPLAGAFMDATGTYDASFYLSGSLILASALICYPLNCINRWERKRAKYTAVNKDTVPI